jgi:transcriptional regulator with XRE-family HTH domain
LPVENLGERVKRLRIEHGWLQKELATKTGFSSQKVSNIERGYNKEIESEDVLKLANAFGVSSEYILRGVTPEATIKDALNDEPELLNFFINEMAKRDDLKLLFKQVKPLKPETVKRIIRYIKIVEDEEDQE